jgi:NAD(P)-dependent dehydrogenase (short-subunit alcohol dehydrogenase family)
MIWPSKTALTETLARELAPKIRVLLIAPGSFRTEGIYGYDFFTGNPIPYYDDLRTAAVERFDSVPGTELGDPVKAMEAVADVVRGEGVAKGRPWPQYLILGEDAERDVRSKCQKILDALDEWKDVTGSVSYDK